jgi:GDP-mannose 6-dehydrogenase
MLENVLTSNRVHISHAIDAVLARGRPRVGMVGLSFKSGTDDLRESPLVNLAETFIGKGLPLRIYDPEVQVSRLIGANRRFIEESIPHIASLMEDRVETLLEGAEVIVLARNSPDVLDALHRCTRADQWILDLTGNTPRERLPASYQGVCW